MVPLAVSIDQLRMKESKSMDGFPETGIAVMRSPEKCAVNWLSIVMLPSLARPMSTSRDGHARKDHLQPVDAPRLHPREQESPEQQSIDPLLARSRRPLSLVDDGKGRDAGDRSLGGAVGVLVEH
jgi:hypothetical protein